MVNCLLCNIAKGEVESIRIYEDELVFAIMDIFPEAKGHLLIVPKIHKNNLFDIDNDILIHIIKISKKIAVATKIALKADGIKIAQFNGKAAGQTIMHYHMHIVPAYQGVAFRRHAGKIADSKELKKLAKLIKAKL